MIINNNITKANITNKTQQSFKGIKADKIIKNFVITQEPGDIKYSRLFQDIATNWIPKSLLTRSLADFSEMTFLEYTESGLFYFAGEIIGKPLRKLFSKVHPKNLQNKIFNLIPKSAKEIVANEKINKNTKRRAITAKAAIILACTAIPAAEYALSFAKNLFTLKVFKKSDFNNVVNLNKKQNQTEDKAHQEKVKNSANRHIKDAGLVSLGGLAGSLVLAKYGHKSSVLTKLSDTIIRPGEYLSKALQKAKITKENGKIDKFLKKYITPDFSNDKGNLKLSKGQLLVSTVTGFFGYSRAGKDRGRLDQLEVWSRVPFVVFYTVFGCSIFDNLFKKYLLAKNKFPELIKKGKDGNIADVPLVENFKTIAEKLAKKNKTNVEEETKKLFEQKAAIVGIPYAFGIIVMGFLLAGINRFWTQHRYNKQQEKLKELNNPTFTANDKTVPNAYKVFAN